MDSQIKCAHCHEAVAVIIIIGLYLCGKCALAYVRPKVKLEMGVYPF